MKKYLIALSFLMILLFSFANCKKEKIDYQERLEKIKTLKNTNEQAYLTHLGNLLKTLDKDDPVYKEALGLMVDQLIESAKKWEDIGRYDEALKIYFQARRMDMDNPRLVELYIRAKAYEDLSIEDFNKILIGMDNNDLHKIAGNPFKIEKKEDDKGNTLHEYHFLTKANKWDSVVITLDDDLKIIDKKFPEIIEQEEEKE